VHEEERGHGRERGAHQDGAAVVGAGAGDAQRERSGAGDRGGRDDQPEVHPRGHHGVTRADEGDDDDRDQRRNRYDEREHA
jgi:hypothetical protein